VVKSIFLIVNIVFYLFHFFLDDKLDVSSIIPGQLFEPIRGTNYLFGEYSTGSGDGITVFLGAILVVIFTLTTVFEIMSMISIYYIAVKTKKMLNKIANMRAQVSGEENSPANIIRIHNAEQEMAAIDLRSVRSDATTRQQIWPGDTTRR